MGHNLFALPYDVKIYQNNYCLSSTDPISKISIALQFFKKDITKKEPVFANFNALSEDPNFIKIFF